MNFERSWNGDRLSKFRSKLEGSWTKVQPIFCYKVHFEVETLSVPIVGVVSWIRTLSVNTYHHGK